MFPRTEVTQSHTGKDNLLSGDAAEEAKLDKRKVDQQQEVPITGFLDTGRSLGQTQTLQVRFYQGTRHSNLSDSPDLSVNGSRALPQARDKRVTAR